MAAHFVHMRLVILLSISAAALALQRAEDTVTTSFGCLQGVLETATSTRSFHGIPYAKAPIGALRFVDPSPWDSKWPSTRDATKAGPQCISNSQKSNSAEDCLFINVHTPINATASSNLPVLLFIHGGSFVEGAGSDYDGSVLAERQNVVVATINYRLGSFGFLQLADSPTSGAGESGRGARGKVASPLHQRLTLVLSPLPPPPAPANFGLKDQRQAMKWAQGEIGSFGGDPAKVMVFGESAGAISVQLHTVMTRSDKLFTHALSESGFLSTAPQPWAQKNAATYAAAAGCPAGAAGRACLQGKPVATLLAASEKTSPGKGNPFVVPGWGPSVDGVEFSADSLALVARGQLNDVTIIAGSNTDEGWLFAPQGDMTAEQYTTFATEVLFGHGKPFNQTQLDAVMKQYPPTPPNSRPAAVAMVGDLTFVCGTRYLARVATAYASAPPRIYHFNVPTAGLVLHASELPYVFNYGRKTPEHQLVADGMGRLWASFVKGGPAEAEWPVYANATDTNILFQADVNPSGGFKTETGRRQEYCDFWEGLLYGPYAGGAAEGGGGGALALASGVFL
jgi:para-nitrobenzyl esterase